VAGLISINVRADVKKLTRSLDDFAKRQVPFATAQALTAVAMKVQEAETKALAETFENPTPFTLKSIGVKGARKSNLTATVFVKDIAAKYLEPYETGGKHYLNPSKRGGTLLNPKNVRLNQYGNLTARKLQSLKGRPDIFIGTIVTKKGQAINGVWQRPRVAKATRKGAPRKGAQPQQKGGLKLLIRFGDALPVKQHLNYRQRAEKIVRDTFQAEMSKALAAAMKTAR